MFCLHNAVYAYFQISGAFFSVSVKKDSILLRPSLTVNCLIYRGIYAHLSPHRSLRTVSFFRNGRKVLINPLQTSFLKEGIITSIIVSSMHSVLKYTTDAGSCRDFILVPENAMAPICCSPSFSLMSSKPECRKA